MLCLFAVDIRHGSTWLAAVGVACTLSLLQVPCKHLGVAVPASKAAILKDSNLQLLVTNLKTSKVGKFFVITSRILDICQSSVCTKANLRSSSNELASRKPGLPLGND